MTTRTELLAHRAEVGAVYAALIGSKVQFTGELLLRDRTGEWVLFWQNGGGFYFAKTEEVARQTMRFVQPGDLTPEEFKDATADRPSQPKDKLERGIDLILPYLGALPKEEETPLCRAGACRTHKGCFVVEEVEVMSLTSQAAYFFPRSDMVLARTFLSACGRLCNDRH